MPWKRRWLLARRPELASGVHTVALRTIERWCAAAGGAPKTSQTGSVTATQRFGSALNCTRDRRGGVCARMRKRLERWEIWGRTGVQEGLTRGVDCAMMDGMRC